MTKRTHTVTIPFKNETKNMVRFEVPKDEKADALVPTLYVNKSAFPDCPVINNWPDSITVTLETS